jgi:hypothetical protein
MRAGTIILGVAIIGGMGMQGLHLQSQREELSLLREELLRVSGTVGRLEQTLLETAQAPVQPWAGPAPVHAAPPLAGIQAAPAPVVAAQAPTAPTPAPAFDPAASPAELEASFQAESVDSGWASEAQREVRDTLASLLPTTASVRTLDCRATRCRLEVHFPAEAEFRTAMGSPGGMMRLWRGPAMSRVERDATRGTVTLVSYLMRPEAGTNP